MTIRIQFPILATTCAVLLGGCGQKPASSRASDPGSPKAAPPTASARATPSEPASDTTPAPSTPAPTSAPAATAPDITARLKTFATAQSDPILGSIGTDLAAKAKSLLESTAGDEVVKSKLNSSLLSLVGGKDIEALGSAFQVAQAANLTPQQVQIAKEVGSLASAYAVQRNFAALDGAQGDVATLVNSLRKGEVAAAIPPIQKLSQNAQLTPAQKDVVTSLADRYAPGVKKAADALTRGMQGVKSLPGLKQ